MFTLPIDTLIVFTVTTPFVGWIERKLHQKIISGIYAAVGFALSDFMLYQLSSQALSSPMVVPIHAGVFEACLRVDALSVFAAAIFLAMGFLVTVYSLKYMERDTGLSLYYTLLLAMITGMLGVVAAGDFFTLFVFWEFMCIPSYVLVAFRKQQWEPVEAGFKYLVMSSAGSATILYGMSILYGLTGTLNFAQLSVVMTSAAANVWGYVSLAFILIGFGVKASMFPLHTWLPDAHPAAPSSISALLSGIVIKAGAYGIIRTLFMIFLPSRFSWQIALAVFAALTMTYGNFAALLQKDIKRLLAYSSIAQMGYILFAISTTTSYGLTAGLMHTMNHALMKGLLFLCAGAFIYRAGTRNLDELKGIGHRMPLTAVIFTVAALSISGVPPLNGFVSEFMIVYAGVNAGMLAFTVVMLINILLGFAYYLRLIKIIVWSTPTENVKKVKRAPTLMLLPMALMALSCIIIGLYPAPFIEMASKAAQAVI